MGLIEKRAIKDFQDKDYTNLTMQQFELQKV